MNEKDSIIEDKKLFNGMRRLQEMKAARKSGKVVFYLDGGVIIREVEITEKI